MKKLCSVNKQLFVALTISAAGFGLSGCGEKSNTLTTSDGSAQSSSPLSFSSPLSISSPLLISSDVKISGVSQVVPLTNGSVSVSEYSGLQLFNHKGEVLSRYEGKFELADIRIVDGSLRLLATNKNNNKPSLFSIEENTLKLLNEFESPKFNIDGLCLHYDSPYLFGFYLDGEGRGQQWLLPDTLAAKPIRSFATAPGSFCAVDDNKQVLYISEEATGIWAYDANAESQSGRALDALSAQWGGFIGNNVAALAAIPNGYAVISADDQLVTLVEDGELVQQFSLKSSVKTEQLSVSYDNNAISFSAVDDEGQIFRWDHQYETPKTTVTSHITGIKASAQTQAMPRLGDVADDPAIWFNSANAQNSLILGTNKTAGLHSYDLQGQQKQFLATGRVNNVDIAYQATLSDKKTDIAAASLRNNNTIAMFGISTTGQLSEAGQVATTMESIYGLCMFQNQGKTYVLANDKSGLYQQYEVAGDSLHMTGTLTREFTLPGQPEGCAVDEKQQLLFMGEEDAGIWVLDVSDDNQRKPKLIHEIGDHLTDDVEGMAIYHGTKQSYLVVSSQGNNSYAIFNSHAPFAYQGSFRIDMNVELGIDGTSETDGLDVSSKNFGGIYSEGMLVVQDGHNVFPSEAQNFKVVPWSAIKGALKLD